VAVDWSDDSILSLLRIHERIAALAGQDAAERWIERVSERVDLAEYLPFASREVPEYKVRTFREVFEADYRILYRVVPGGIEVVTVFHGSMQLNDPD
jgi:plasmid stabilization system protein ParE